MKKTRSVLALLLFLIIHVTPSFAAISPTKNFITIADIHFNPFIGCNLLPSPCPILNELRTANPQSWDSIFKKHADKIRTQYYQDTDYALLKSTLTELHTLNQQQKPMFILLLGDFLAHNFPEKYKKYSDDKSKLGYQLFTKKTFEYLVYQLNQAAPNTKIYPVLGNNDSYNGNYSIDPQGLFLSDTSTLFSTLIKNTSTDFKKDFSNAGYYAVTLPQQIRLIVLNSVIFSNLYSNKSIQQQIAEEQLVWLQKRLSLAKQQNQHVLLALHVPFGMDVYKYVKKRFTIIRYFSHSLFWNEDYNEQFISLLREYSTTLIAILPAHIHDDAFQLLFAKTNHRFILSSLTPSISPVYGNNPGFKVFSYNPNTFQLSNFITYFYPLSDGSSAKWKQEYNFNAVYQPHCTQCSLVNGVLNLKKDNALMDAYKQYYAVGKDAQPITKQKWILEYFCGIYAMNWKDYKMCLELR